MSIAAPTPAEDSAPPQTLRARNPATGAILGSVQATAPEQVEQVVGATRRM
jgi:acyl-CoA reductase-like NAD-dependent aldehyde dehydrogenase